jgi:O-antigen/teichoic acid export membrane protein
VSADAADTRERVGAGRSLRGDVLITFGGKAVFVLCVGLLTVIVARELGPSGQGVFATAFSLSLILVQLGSLGLPVSNPYFAARDEQAQRAIVMHSLWLAVLVAALLAAGAVAVRAVAPGALPGIGWLELALTLAAMPAALATLYLQGVLLGQQRMVAYNLVEVVQAVSSLVALLIALAVADVDIATVLLVLASGRYIAFVFALFALRHVLLGPGAHRPGLMRGLLVHGGKVYLVGFVIFVLVRLDLLLVNALVGADDAGQYSIAAYIAEGLVLIPMVIGINLLPRIAKTTGSETSAEVLRLVVLIWGAICVLSAPGAAIGIPLLFGDSYDGAIELYLWLLPGTLAVGLLNSLTVHYFVRGYPPALIGTWAAALVGNVVLNLILLPEWGVAAAPILSSVAYGLVLVAHVRVFAGEAGGYRALVPGMRDVRVLLRRAG